jgi:hypothetical protein
MSRTLEFSSTTSTSRKATLTPAKGFRSGSRPRHPTSHQSPSQVQLLAEEFKTLTTQAKLSVSLDNIFSSPEFRTKVGIAQRLFLSFSRRSAAKLPASDRHHPWPLAIAGGMSPTLFLPFLLPQVILGIALYHSSNESIRVAGKSIVVLQS